MSQHLSKHDIQDLLNRSLSPDRLLAVDGHLSECPECQAMAAECEPKERIMALLSDVFPPENDLNEHLTYEQLKAYVDDEIGEIDKEIVDLHRADCHDCAEQIAELVHLRSTLQLDGNAGRSPAELSGESRLIRFWKSLTSEPIFRIAAPALGAVLLGVVVWSAWVSSRRMPAEIVEVIDTTADHPADISNKVVTAPPGGSNSNSDLPKPLISLADAGTRIEIDEKGVLSGLKAPQFESRVKTALTTQNIEISTEERELRGRTGVLMGDGRPGVPFALTGPVGKLVQPVQPQFGWRPLAGAESYVVTVYDVDFNKVVESPPVRRTVWKSGTKLKRGFVYQWQVTAVKGGEEIKSPVRPAPDARFKVIDVKAANEIEAAKRSGNSHLLLGIAYANAGLIDDAVREFQALLDKNPRSEVAKRLLNKVKAAK